MPGNSRAITWWRRPYARGLIVAVVVTAGLVVTAGVALGHTGPRPIVVASGSDPTTTTLPTMSTGTSAPPSGSEVTTSTVAGGPSESGGPGTSASGTSTTDAGSPPVTVTRPPVTDTTAMPKLVEAGTGGETTKSFSVPDPWFITWSYDCSNLGPDTAGGFGVSVLSNGDPADLPVSTDRESGHGTATENRSGTFALWVNTQCRWRVQVSA